MARAEVGVGKAYKESYRTVKIEEILYIYLEQHTLLAVGNIGHLLYPHQHVRDIEGESNLRSR